MTETSAPRVTWAELFYDLIIAASMLFLYGSLAKHLSAGEFVWLSTIALMVFAIWTSTTLIYNRLPSDSTSRRLLVIAQMVLIVFAVASIERSDKVDGDIGLVSLGGALLVLSFMWFQVDRSRHTPKHPDRIPAFSALAGGLFLILAGLLPDSLNQVQAIAGGLIAFAPLFLLYLPRIVRLDHLDPHHLAERLGQLTLIMIGETFLEMAVLFTKGADPRVGGVLIVLGILIVIWWQYFSFVGNRPMQITPARIDIYLLGHAMLVIGLGSAALSLTEIALAIGESMTLPVLAGILGFSLACTYGGMALIVAATSRPAPILVPLLVAAGVFAALALALHATFSIDELATGLIMSAVALVTLVACAVGARIRPVVSQAA